MTCVRLKGPVSGKKSSSAASGNTAAKLLPTLLKLAVSALGAANTSSPHPQIESSLIGDPFQRGEAEPAKQDSRLALVATTPLLSRARMGRQTGQGKREKSATTPGRPM